MNEVSLKPEKLSKVFQLVGVWLAASVLLAGAFLGGAISIGDPAWLRAVLALSGIGIVVIGFVGAFLLITVFRPYIADDSSFFAWWEKTAFRGYKSEVQQVTRPEEPVEVVRAEVTSEADPYPVEAAFDAPRREKYRANAGVFLVHSWRPSKARGQVADIVIRLEEHPGADGERALSEGLIRSVAYNLGPFFSAGPIVKANAEDGYRLDVAAYGTFLCLALVEFNDGRAPVELDRYIDFPTTGVK